MAIDTLSQRVAYGETLVALGAENPNVVVLEADLGKSTMGIKFEQAYPERFYEMGIAEANMAGVAAGLSLTGKIPFMASFAVFSSGRCFDQIRTAICIPRLNVKICGSSSGLSDFGDGSTHQCVEDVATMRSLPNMQVFIPCDAIQTEQIVRYMAANEGPMYLRVNRNNLPNYTNQDEPFVPGKVYTLRQGTDVAVFAYGVMVSRAMEAAQYCAGQGISVRVVNVPSIKPLDGAAIQKIASGVKGIVTAEEGSILGGMGSAIAEVLAPVGGCPIEMVGVRDSFGTSAGNYEELLNYYHLTSEAIAEAVIKIMHK